jgi:RHS repeat-associated protein
VYDGTNAIVDLDRFNRITTNRWTKDLSTDRDLYQTVITYDRNSNITSIEDNVHTGLDVKYTMDSVNRLIQAEEGTLSSGSITSKTRDQQWTLSHTGNWAREKLDLNGDGDFSDTSEHDDTRTHNAVNELTARDTDSNASNNFTLSYDAAGNLSDDGEHYEYEYDAFYRLRKVKNTSTQALVAEYRYNALNHRIGVHEDSDTDGDVDSNDKWYYDAFDERWRLLARFRESDTAPKEDFVPHQAGASGQGGSSYIDLVICRNRDADTAWTAASDGTLEERNYLLQNWRADVSAVVSGSGLLKEWVKYSSYGIPIGLPGGDTDSDGDCDATDITQVQTWITASAYDVRGDVDLDGDVDASDKSELQTNYQGITLGRGVLSSNGIASRKGYAGYEGLTNLAGSQWLARNRVLMAELGRWGRRDPLGYVDGLSLLRYARGNPIRRNDRYGTISESAGIACRSLLQESHGGSSKCWTIVITSDVIKYDGDCLANPQCRASGVIHLDIEPKKDAGPECAEEFECDPAGCYRWHGDYGCDGLVNWGSSGLRGSQWIRPIELAAPCGEIVSVGWMATSADGGETVSAYYTLKCLQCPRALSSKFVLEDQSQDGSFAEANR